MLMLAMESAKKEAESNEGCVAEWWPSGMIVRSFGARRGKIRWGGSLSIFRGNKQRKTSRRRAGRDNHEGYRYR